jgi:hypothetical protein
MRMPGYTADSVILDNTNKRNHQTASWFRDTNKEKVLPQISAVSCRCEPDCDSHTTLGSLVCTWRDPVFGVRRERQRECFPDLSRIRIGPCSRRTGNGCKADRSVLLANGQWQNCKPSDCPPEICDNIEASEHTLIRFT